MRCYRIKKSSNPKENTAWKWFAKYIKTRDAIKTTGDIYYAKCITCGEVHPIEDTEDRDGMDAGHAIPGRMNSILFNEDLVNAQCRNCNRTNKGEKQMYKQVLIDRHGQDFWDFWQTEKNKPVKFTNFDYEQISKSYREKYKALIKGCVA